MDIWDENSIKKLESMAVTMSCLEIANDFGISKQRISLVARKNGVVIRRPAEIRLERTLHMHSKGCSVQEIADDIGVGYSAVWQILKRQGLTHNGKHFLRHTKLEPVNNILTMRFV